MAWSWLIFEDRVELVVGRITAVGGVGDDALSEETDWMDGCDTPDEEREVCMAWLPFVSFVKRDSLVTIQWNNSLPGPGPHAGAVVCEEAEVRDEGGNSGLRKSLKSATV